MKTNWLKAVTALALVGGLATSAGAAHAYGYGGWVWGPSNYSAWGTLFANQTVTDGTSPSRTVNLSTWAGNFFGTYLSYITINSNSGVYSSTNVIACSNGTYPTEQFENVSTPSAGNTLVECPAGMSAIEAEAVINN
jgi:hypothetical protein